MPGSKSRQLIRVGNFSPRPHCPSSRRCKQNSQILIKTFLYRPHTIAFICIPLLTSSATDSEYCLCQLSHLLIFGTASLPLSSKYYEKPTLVEGIQAG